MVGHQVQFRVVRLSSNKHLANKRRYKAIVRRLGNVTIRPVPAVLNVQVQLINSHVHNKNLVINRRLARVRRTNCASNKDTRLSSLVLRNIIIATRLNNRRRSITIKVRHVVVVRGMIKSRVMSLLRLTRAIRHRRVVHKHKRPRRAIVVRRRAIQAVMRRQGLATRRTIHVMMRRRVLFIKVVTRGHVRTTTRVLA